MDIHIAEIDTEKYINWLLNHEGTSKEKEVQRLKKRLEQDLLWIENNTNLSDEEKQIRKNEERQQTTILITEISKYEYWKPPTEKEKQALLYFIENGIEWRTRRLNELIETIPLDRKTVLTREIEIALKDLQKYNDIHKEVINGRVVQDFGKLSHYIALVRFAQYINTEITNKEALTPQKNTIGLTHPQKIILLEKIGFFKLDKLNQLTNGQRDKLISLLISEDETNTRKYINGLSSRKDTDSYNPYKNPANETAVNKLLNKD